MFELSIFLVVFLPISDKKIPLFSSLLALYQKFISLLGDAAVLDLTQAKLLAKDSLKQASDAGFSVLKADALVSTRFAKLDELGHYLPSATTYQQGWRCVEDTQITGKRRVWSLLKDGLPNGKDDIAYDASSAGIPSVLGSNGYLESENTAQLCGFSDWKVPHLVQLLSIKTKDIPKNSKLTLDTEVFPNHLALLPEYDKSGGVRFYYWSNMAYQGEQYVFTYDTNKASEGTAEQKTDGSEDRVVLARLVREEANSYELLNSSGVVVSDRSSAVCARDNISGLTWQLFSGVDKNTRFKKYIDAQSLLEDQKHNSICGKSNWRFPAKTEFYGLVPTDNIVFAYNDVKHNEYNYNRYYITNNAVAINMDTGKEKIISTSQYDYSKYLFRFVAN
ncbi:Putative uncharacterized protein [Moritella viscosa]|uniref:DUF1566 domain-containing protein n=1 Tax=Moritella viscosa TaxID=80854 RepID=UPI000917EFF4|nr:DUF1566 domain-containing protein [Moritella viscosa]SHO11241.1 Putative uncharacterized protein [Moritella viscosa]SHO11262.1 Putative uncharacterized protein [Moritella viscosa]SHO12468.1 Putative uncharacterized protein [Moritella viscosa]SHO16023.1 Putative uncharacterized protein [Moritella viscosa]SHO17853.1 Putative uncharacterized protein [Moritella viscosa]